MFKFLSFLCFSNVCDVILIYMGHSNPETSAETIIYIYIYIKTCVSCLREFWDMLSRIQAKSCSYHRPYDPYSTIALSSLYLPMCFCPMKNKLLLCVHQFSPQAICENPSFQLLCYAKFRDTVLNACWAVQGLPGCVI